MLIRGITFDFWFTLFQKDPSEAAQLEGNIGNIFTEIAAQHGQEVSAEKASRLWDFANDLYRQAWTRGEKFGARERSHAILSRLGINPTEILLDHAVARLEQISYQTSLVLLPGAKEILEQLAPNFKIGLVCDSGVMVGKILRHHMQLHGILQYFDALSFSDETEHTKPAAEAFGYALNAMSVEPQNCIHIGDIPRTDIAGAQALGYAATVRFRAVEDRLEPPFANFAISNHLELLNIIQTLQTK